MLSLFRQGGIVQILMGGVVVLIIAAFAITFQGGGGSLSDRVCVAEVYGECLSQTDYDANYRLAVFPGVPAKQLKAMGFPRDVLDGLVERELLYREATQLGLSVSDDSVDDELFLGRFHFSLATDNHAGRPMIRPSRVRHSKTGRFDYAIYKREVINLTRMTPKEFKERQRREIVAERLRNLIMSQVRVSDQELFAKYERENSKAKADVAKVSFDWFSRYALELTDEAVESFTAANQSQVDAEWEKVKDSLEEGCLLYSEIVAELKPGSTDEDKVEQRERIDAAAERLKKLTPFETLARQLGTSSAALAGGRMGCLPESDDTDDQLLKEALDGLVRGRTSKVVETTRGFHILRFDGKLDAAAVESTGKAIAARRAFVAEQGKSLAAQFARDVAAAVSGGKALADATRELAEQRIVANGITREATIERALDDPAAPKVESTTEFTSEGRPIPDARLPGVAQLAFDLEPGQALSEPIATRDGFAVLVLIEKNLATKEQFEEAKLQLKEQLQALKGVDALRAYVDRLRDTAAEKIKVNNEFLAEVNKDEAAEG